MLTPSYKYPGAVLNIVVFDILDIEGVLIKENTYGNNQKWISWRTMKSLGHT